MYSVQRYGYCIIVCEVKILNFLSKKICFKCDIIFFTDNNECLVNNGDCSQKCENTLGSFECQCLIGFKLNVDKRTCDGRFIQ